MIAASEQPLIDEALEPSLHPTARTLAELLCEKAAERPDGLAAMTGDAAVTYAELRDRATRLAGAIRGRGIGRGDRVGVLMGNGIEWLEAVFGAAMAGATAVPFSTWSTRDELAFLIRDSGVRVIFIVPNFGPRDFAADLAAVLNSQQADQPMVPDVVFVKSPAAHGHDTLEAFLRGPSQSSGEAPRPDDDVLILYTSGSTSAPKGVRLSHAGAVSNGFHIGERQGLRPDDRVFLSVPLFWSYGGVNALPATFSHGATLVLTERFEPATALDLIERLGCTAIYTLPGMTSALVRHPDFRPDRVASLRTGLTIGSPEDFTQAVERLGVSEICNIYGATETYGNCCVTWHHWPVQSRAGCQGTPLPDQELRFRDRETGEILPRGGTGLVEVRGCVSPGYTGASAALNDSAFTEDGFYRTGDVGFIDRNGAFVFVARDTDMIKRAGINVSPAEVEDVLSTHPEVAQCAVTGVPDAQRGELIVAYVIPEGSCRPEPDALMRHCGERLSKYKLPDHIEICSELPLTSTGKLQRKQLKTQALERIAALRGESP